MSRADFHQQRAAQATADAQRLLDRQASLGDGWLTWVASELYQLSPPEYAAMVRRELQRLSTGRP